MDRGDRLSARIGSSDTLDWRLVVTPWRQLQLKKKKLTGEDIPPQIPVLYQAGCRGVGFQEHRVARVRSEKQINNK